MTESQQFNDLAQAKGKAVFQQFSDLAQAEGTAVGSPQVPTLDTLAGWLSDPGPTCDDAKEFARGLDADLTQEQIAYVAEHDSTPLEGSARLFASWPEGPKSNTAFTAANGVGFRHFTPRPNPPAPCWGYRGLAARAEIPQARAFDDM